MEPFVIKRGDLGASLLVTLKDKDALTGVETLANLVGKTVKFCMRKMECVDGIETEGEVVINNAAAVIFDEEGAQVQYDWQEGDTDEEGTFRGEFKVLSGGRPITYPTQGYISILIEDSVD